MPFSFRKKSAKGEARPKSTFFDTQVDEEPSVTIRKKPEKDSSKDSKRTSKSKFYDTADIYNSTSSVKPNGTLVSTDKPPHHDGKPVAFESRGDLGTANAQNVWSRRTSILSRSFYDTLHDTDLLPYFIQYMTSQHRAHLVKFWLDANNFASATLSRYRVKSLIEGTMSSGEDSLLSSPRTSLQNSTASEDSTYEHIKQDAVNIYSRYIALDSTLPIGITEELRNSAISKICCEDGKLDPLCFKECQEFVERLLEKDFYKDFMESDCYRKYQIDCLTSGHLQLIDVLYNDNLMFYFREYVEQENASELLQFWMAADNFQTQVESNHTGECSELSSEDIQSDAMIIYEKYFSLQASNPLGFQDKVRMCVELNICREGGPLADCFLIPKCIILETINKTLFEGFLRSQIYIRLLTELINSVQSNSQLQTTPKLALQRTGSTLSDSLSTHSGDIHTGNLSAASSITDVSDVSDSSRRRNKRQIDMSLGMLDEFGQFTSAMDLEDLPDIDRKKGNRFTRKKKEKERAQEDMAWQIARMIINDISTQSSAVDWKPDKQSLSLPSSRRSSLSISPTMSVLRTASQPTKPNTNSTTLRKSSTKRNNANSRKLSEIEQLTEDFLLFDEPVS